MDEKYRKMNNNSKIIVDALGTKIDEGVRVLVVLLNYNGMVTRQSCWGHKNHGLPYPWIDIENKYLDDINSIISDLEIGTEPLSDWIRIYPKCKDMTNGRIVFNKLKEKLKKQMKLKS